MKSKIAFVILSSFSNINESVKTVLRETYPEKELVILDIFRIVKSNKLFYSLNIFFSIIEYVTDLLSGKKSIKDCFVRNSFMFFLVKRIVHRRLNPSSVLFSVQTQSVFDASRKGIPHFVYTDHTMMLNLRYKSFNNYKLPSKRWLKKEYSIYKNAELVFTMSTSVTDSLIQEYNLPPKKIVKILAGSNLPLTQKMLEKRDYAKKNILFVGGNWNRKGGPVLLKAFESLKEKHPDVSLTIVSSKAPKVDISNCSVFGRLPLNDVAEKFSEASIFCLPTLLEPFGIVFVEAMMYSLPIVATSIGAIPDFVINGLTGYSVPPDDYVALAEALDKLLSDPEHCKQLGLNGFQQYSDFYNWQKVGQRMKVQIDFILKEEMSVEPETKKLNEMINSAV